MPGYSPSKSYVSQGLIDKLLFEHVGLPNILDLAVHLVNFWLDGSRGSFLATFTISTSSTPSCLKFMGWWVGVGGPCDVSVSPSPFGLDFGILDC